MKSNRIVLSLGVTCVIVAMTLSTVSGIPRIKYSTKHQDIKRLLELNGAKNSQALFVDQILTTIKTNSPSDKVGETLDRFRAEIDMDELLEITATVYDSHFSQDDIHALIVFYESPVGRKLTKAMPDIIRDSIEEGQKWAQRVTERVLRTLEKETGE